MAESLNCIIILQIVIDFLACLMFMFICFILQYVLRKEERSETSYDGDYLVTKLII